MTRFITPLLLTSAMFVCQLGISANCDAQVYAGYPVAASPIPMQPVAWSYNQPVIAIPVQMTYAAYYAPQVPVVAMAPGPVPTVSAYYVPTAPITLQYYAPTAPPRHFKRHRAKHQKSVAVIPVAIQPIYWTGY